MDLDNHGNKCISSVPPTDCCTGCNSMGNKLEPRNVPVSICSPAQCSIFGGHDNYTSDRETCRRSRNRLRSKRKNLNTLGSPVGLVTSSFAIKSSDGKGPELHAQRYATYLKAFAKSYITPENDWDTAAVDSLLKEGQLLYTESKQYPLDEMTEQQLMIYSDTEAKVKRTFDIDGYSFQIELDTVQLPLDIPDELQEGILLDIKLESLKTSLKEFFGKAKYCLMKISNWYLLIWKCRRIYFIFDFYGRRVADCMTDRDSGVAMLICLKSLDNVCHLINNLSGLQKTDSFNLRQMTVVKFTGPDGKTIIKEFGKRVSKYVFVNADYAYLKAALHLTLNRADPLRNRSALPVGVGALIASKIEHPASWDDKVLDRLICFGVNICRCCWEECLQSNDPIQLDNFPDFFRIGQYNVKFMLTPRAYEGTWKCVPYYKRSELAIAIEKAFEASDNNILVQVNHQIYAIWKKNDFIYLFDPYRHGIVSNLPEKNTEEKSATLRVFRNMNIFFTVFTQILLESNRTTFFYIHKLQVKKLEHFKKVDAALSLTSKIDEDAPDVKSLNGRLCFEDDDTVCRDELGTISDYEEEDITGNIVQMDLRESESDEAEEGLEEEEGGKGEISEVESSSSDDGSGRRKKKGAKGGKGKKKTKSTDKSSKGKGKGKKGKGKGKATDKGAKDDDDMNTKKSKKKRKGDSSNDDDDQNDEKNKTKQNKKDKASDSDDDELKENKPKYNKDEDSNAMKPKPETDINKPKTDINKPKTDINKPKTDINKPKTDINKKKTEPGTGKTDPRGGAGGKDSKSDAKASSKSAGGASGRGRGASGSRDARGDKGHDDSAKDVDDQACGTVSKQKNYPGYSNEAYNMAVVGSESGTYESICKLLRAGFKCADRILTMTPWGNYVVFRAYDEFLKAYFIFDGCTCNVSSFRHLNLNSGTAGLLCLKNLHDVITYIIDSQKTRTGKMSHRTIVDEICKQYCT